MFGGFLIEKEVNDLDINIRNVEPAAVRKLDELAKRKSVSRSEYIRELLNTMAYLEMNNNLFDRMEKQIETNNALMDATIHKVDELVQVMKELLHDD